MEPMTRAQWEAWRRVRNYIRPDWPAERNEEWMELPDTPRRTGTPTKFEQECEQFLLQLDRFLAQPGRQLPQWLSRQDD